MTIANSNSTYKRNISTGNFDGVLPSRDFVRRISRRNPALSTFKVCAYIGSLTFFICLYLAHSNTWTALSAIFGLGVTLAHGVELQHEALHGNLFQSSRLNRLCGTVLGMPLLISYTHYRSYHLHHHRSVGGPDDEEIVNYAPFMLTNPVAFAVRAWNLLRIPTFMVTFLKALQNEYPEKIPAKERATFAREYLFLMLAFGSAVFLSLWYESTLVLVLWLAPWLLVAEPLHFLIEIPEHIGCERMSPSILRNTRSYKANSVWRYLINHNNYHIEHHLYPGVPSHRLHVLHDYVRRARGHCNATYGESLGEVIATVRRL
ncbi:fatty acid desaturase [Sphingomonas sp. SORGH_AS 950]|uniref:fatty acid desaturase family protein n=1 Tax=Sphingomonas sp. SORGH_AS_0950 TaxID=3041792 RepID=UPI00278B138D|nr:fatty acid desaturase [Sphingomonas sp. SORGH_AS_0950]MDQ1159615.1 fatty acid desaturase [Sphingomonas sp. SORGH_AS_0950]